MTPGDTTMRSYDKLSWHQRALIKHRLDKSKITIILLNG